MKTELLKIITELKLIGLHTLSILKGTIRIPVHAIHAIVAGLDKVLIKLHVLSAPAITTTAVISSSVRTAIAESLAVTPIIVPSTPSVTVPEPTTPPTDHVTTAVTPEHTTTA